MTKFNVGDTITVDNIVWEILETHATSTDVVMHLFNKDVLGNFRWHFVWL